MLDYKTFEILSKLEQMLGKQSYYLVDAVKSGNLDNIVIKFEVEKDAHGVTTNVQQVVDLVWIK